MFSTGFKVNIHLPKMATRPLKPILSAHVTEISKVNSSSSYTFMKTHQSVSSLSFP